MGRQFLLAFLIMFTLSFSGNALAGEEDATSEKEYLLEPQIVTADKQEKDAQDIPGSVSVISDVQVQDYNIISASDLFQRMPNLFMVKTGPTSGFTAVRGITSYMNGNPPLGIYVDDVYYPGADPNIFDVERVEVLRGPQGTLYGHNTEAGVINVITKQPQEEWHTSIGAGYGNYNTKDFLLSTGGALVEDTMSMRAFLKVKDTDGYFTNTANDSDDVDEQTQVDFRGTLRWTPTNKWDVRLTTGIENYSGNYAEFALLNDLEDHPHDVDVDFEGKNAKDGRSVALRASYDMGNMRFLSVTSHRYEDYDLDNDIDFTSSSSSISNLYIDQEKEITSQEVRLSSNNKNSPFKWVTGVYLFSEGNDEATLMEVVAPMTVNFKQKGKTDSRGASVFGQASYLFWDKLELTAGLRYDREKKDFDYKWDGGAMLLFADTSGESEKLFQAWLPKFAASYKFTDDFSAYASVARGSKSGGFNIHYNPGEPFDSEYNWSYEVGVKSRWLNNRLQADLAAFLIKWEDMQVQIPMSGSVYRVENAGKATSKGFEAELTARPLKGWEIIAGAAMTHSVFDEYDYSGDDLSGNRVPNVPGFSANLGTTYRFGNGFFLNAEYVRNSSFYWDVENTEQQDAYHIVNAKIGYEQDGYEVYAWGKNLTDTVYATRAFKSNGKWYGRAGDPLTFGVSCKVNF
mgnify:CR=1 FL=1